MGNVTVYVPVNEQWMANFTDPSRFQNERFDAAPHARHFGPAEAKQCLHGARVLVVGDSTSRDTFYELTTMGGMAMSVLRQWPEGAWTPLERASTSMGRDQYGHCGADISKSPPVLCTRDLVFSGNNLLSSQNDVPQGHGRRSTLAGNLSNLSVSRASFAYVAGNSSVELATLRALMDRHLELPYTAVFVQCPIWSFLMPKVYSSAGVATLSHKDRHRIVRPRDYRALGDMCREIIDAVRDASPPSVQVYMLGLSQFAVDASGLHEDEPLIMESLHHALGISCTVEKFDNNGGSPRPDGMFGAHTGRYSVTSPQGITPIDRYNIWGMRKRDGIHPFFSGQAALAQLMLNHLCPPNTV